jgi:hypothetical protein
MQKIIVSIAVSIAMGFLQKLTKTVWELIWNEIFAAIVLAEKKWNDLGKGAVKKDWFINEIVRFINGKRKMNGVQEWAMRKFLNVIADEIVKELNSQLGNDWVEKADRVKELLEKKIPFVKG